MTIVITKPVVVLTEEAREKWEVFMGNDLKCTCNGDGDVFCARCDHIGNPKRLLEDDRNWQPSLSVFNERRQP